MTATVAAGPGAARPAAAAQGPVRRWSRAVAQRARSADPLLWVLLASGLALRAYELSMTWFWQDDFVLLSRATDATMDRAWLLQDYSGHLMPAQYATFWILQRLAPGSWLAAALIVIVLSLLLWAATWWVLTLLYGRTRWRLAALAVVVFCPIAVVSTTWFASALQALPVAGCIAVVLGCHVKALQTGRRRWILLALGSLLLGLAWMEKSLLAVVVAVLADLLLLRQMPGVDGRTRRRTRWALWGGYAVVTAGYLVLYQSVVKLPVASASPGELPRFLYEVVLSVFPVGLAGGPWMQRDDAGTLQPILTQPLLLWVWAGYLGLFIAAVRRGGVGALRPLVVIAGALAVVLTVVARTRLDYLGAVIGRDTRYLAEMVVVVALVGPALWLRPGRADRAGGGRWWPWLVAPALALTYALVAWPSAYLDAQARGATGAREWVDAARTAVMNLPSGTTIADAPVPAGVVSPDFGQDARASRVLHGFGVVASFGRTSLDVRTLTGSGTLSPAELVASASSPPGPATGCGYPVRAQPTVIEVLPEAVATDLAMVIDYYSASDVEPIIEIGGTSAASFLPAGLHTITLFPNRTGSQVRLSGLSADQALCVNRIQLGRFWPATVGGG